MRMFLMAGVACLATLVSNGACVAAERSSTKEPRAVMNVVNFVRALDPRQPRAWYAEALREEVALNRKYKLKNTILFQ